MRVLALLAMLAPGVACADNELYMEVGLGRMWGVVHIERSPDGEQRSEKIPGPHATVEVGYAFGNTSIFAFHTSSVTSNEDGGMEIVGVKHRFSVKLK